jgi:hypothetical protein
LIRWILVLFIVPLSLSGQTYEDSERSLRKNQISINFGTFAPFHEDGPWHTTSSLIYDRRLGKKAREDYWISLAIGAAVNEKGVENPYGILTAKWLESEGVWRLEGAGGAFYNGQRISIYAMAGVRFHFNEGFYFRANYALIEGLGLGLGLSF